jgi:hypothetical protein
MSDEPDKPPDPMFDVLRWIVIGGYASVLLAWGLIFCLWKFGLHEFILRLLASERAELLRVAPDAAGRRGTAQIPARAGFSAPDRLL